MPRSKRPLSVEDLWAIKRIGPPTLSPDGRLACAAVTAYDIVPAALDRAVQAGAKAAGSAAEAARGADLVVTMLPSSPNVESVYTGDGGVLAAARKGTLCVDMSTIGPTDARRIGALLADGGVSMLDAPGKPFHDPAADAALFDALERT